MSADWLAARKRHLLTEIRMQPNSQMAVCPRRLLVARTRGAALVIAIGLCVAGTAVAATLGHWLSGTPAPQSVIADFGVYTPQLGDKPEPGRAVLVAREGNLSLFATDNDKGSYCVIASTPWKRPGKFGDGGSCVTHSQANAGLVAGLVASKSTAAGDETYIIAGRTDDPRARSIRFDDPKGFPIVAEIGSSGFFIAAVHQRGSACASGDWRPAFTLRGSRGEERGRTVRLTVGSALSSGVCQFRGLHP
jgi:hypothetical protein